MSASPPKPPFAPATPARRRLLRGAVAAPALLTLHSGSMAAMQSSLRCLSNANSQTMLPPANWGTTATDNVIRVPVYKARLCMNDPPRGNTWSGATPSGATAPGSASAAPLATGPGALPVNASPRSGLAAAEPAPGDGAAPTPANGCGNEVDIFYIKGTLPPEVPPEFRGPGFPQSDWFLRVDVTNAANPIAIDGPVAALDSPPSSELIPGSETLQGSYVALRIDSSGRVVGVGANAPASGNAGAMIGFSCWTSALPILTNP